MTTNVSIGMKRMLAIKHKTQKADKFITHTFPERAVAIMFVIVALVAVTQGLPPPADQIGEKAASWKRVVAADPSGCSTDSVVSNG